MVILYFQKLKLLPVVYFSCNMLSLFLFIFVIHNDIRHINFSYEAMKRTQNIYMTLVMIDHCNSLFNTSSKPIICAMS